MDSSLASWLTDVAAMNYLSIVFTLKLAPMIFASVQNYVKSSHPIAGNTDLAARKTNS